MGKGRVAYIEDKPRVEEHVFEWNRTLGGKLRRNLLVEKNELSAAANVSLNSLLKRYSGRFSSEPSKSVGSAEESTSSIVSAEITPLSSGRLEHITENVLDNSIFDQLDQAAQSRQRC